MLQEERYKKILLELAAQGAVKNIRLAKMLNVSESTVRRDINELDEMGKLRKVFGGAVELKQQINTIEEDVSMRTAAHVQEKDSIARYAASLIEDYDIVFIDAGSTTERMIDYIENRMATYTTNGIIQAQKLAQKGLKTQIIGGTMRRITLSVIGAEAIKSIDKFNFTKCFMGTNGVDVKRGFTTPNLEEAALKTEAIKHAQRRYILADSSKFNQVSAVSFAEISDAHIITDKLEDSSYRKYTVIEEVNK